MPVFALTVLIAQFFFMLNNLNAQTMKVKNVVLVHGAFADGSGWKGIYEILSKKGYNVTIEPNPLSSLEDDVAATNLALDKLDGPAILAGHSWGGAVISEAGNHPKVAALVYIAAFQPDAGNLLSPGSVRCPLAMFLAPLTEQLSIVNSLLIQKNK